MARKIHKIYDILMKIIILIYDMEFLKYIGMEQPIAEILQTEMTSLGGKTRVLDFLCKLEDDTLCNIEFQFPVARLDDLKRFFDYNIMAEIRNDSLTETVIINFTTSASGEKQTNIGITKSFQPMQIYLGDINYDERLEKINNKEQTNQKLTSSEEIDLMLMCLVVDTTNKTGKLRNICKILKNEEIFKKDRLDVVKSIIKLEIDNLITDDENEKFKEGIKMTPEAEQIINQAVNQVNRKYEILAREEGIKEGKAEGIKEGKIEGKAEGIMQVAKNLKEIHTPQEISKLTGLSVEEIEKL